MEFLCLDFINSRAGNKGVAGDPLTNAVWLRHFCRKWGLAEPEKDITEILLQLQGTISQAAREYSRTGVISPENLSELNSYLNPVLFQNILERKNEEFHVREIPQCAESELLPYQIAMSFADLVSNYELNRLKVCDNPDCGWVFYDESKSRTRLWCDNTCASLIKVRRFRKKQLNA